MIKDILYRAEQNVSTIKSFEQDNNRIIPAARAEQQNTAK
jgi:hypothetical protein